jgi:hypothetical protein
MGHVLTVHTPVICCKKIDLLLSTEILAGMSVPVQIEIDRYRNAENGYDGYDNTYRNKT